MMRLQCTRHAPTVDCVQTIEVLKAKGITHFTPVQAQTYEHILAGRDMIARSRTGVYACMHVYTFVCAYTHLRMCQICIRHIVDTFVHRYNLMHDSIQPAETSVHPHSCHRLCM